MDLVGPIETVSREFFGMHIHRADTITPWPKVPFGSWRLWDAYVTWRDLESDRGLWNFDRLDRLLRLAEEHDVSVLLTLGQSPVWAAVRPTDPSAYSPGASAEPRSLEDWRAYVRTVAERYKGRVFLYEVWNEPDHPLFFTGSIDRMVELGREAYNVVKKVDPRIRIVSPSVTSGSGFEWLDEYLSKGGDAYTDIVGVHFYVTPHPPERIISVAQRAFALTAKHRMKDSPIWNTEMGWVEPRRFTSEKEAASYLARTFILNWALGIRRVYWYAWDSFRIVSIRMIEEDLQTLTPAAVAFREIQQWLIGKRIDKCEVDCAQTWVCALQGDAAYRGWIVWNGEQRTAFQVPASWHVRSVRTLAGATQSLSGSEAMEIDTSPLLIEGERM